MKLFKTKKQIFIITLAAMAAFLVFHGSFFGLVHNISELKKLTKTAAKLDSEYEKLNTEYQKILKGDNFYIEKTARVRYHMAKQGEFEFRINK